MHVLTDAHPGFAAVALVTSFIKTRRSFRKVVGFMLLFTLASPLGIVIGVGISSFGMCVLSVCPHVCSAV